MKTIITQENYEGWLMRYADDALNSAERDEVERFLEAHPELREEMEEVASVRVTPVVATMPGKERLLHREPAAVWHRVAAAVALLLVAGGAWLLVDRQTDTPMQVARVEVPVIPVLPAETEVVAANYSPRTIAHTSQKKHPVQPSAELTVDEPKTAVDDGWRVESVECDAAVAEEVPMEAARPEVQELPPARVAVGYVVTDARLAVNPLFEAFAKK